MNKKAVITGDIVQSRTIKDKAHLVHVLNEVFSELSHFFTFDNVFEIYRGDSFQALLTRPEEALRVAFLIRLGLKKNMLKMDLDARLGIGVGEVSFRNSSIKVSNGEAFELSGLSLDAISKTKKRIQIRTTDMKINEQLDLCNRLVEAIVRRWSKKTAEVVYRYLLYNETQSEIAKQIGVSQSAVQQRLSASDFDAVLRFIVYYEQNLELN